MTSFFQVVAGVLIAVVMHLVIQKQGKDIALILSIGVCVMVMAAAMGFIKPVIEFVDKLSVLGRLNASHIQVMLKAVGIAMIAEITQLICADSGNGALGKGIQFLAGAVILWLSLPIFTSLIELVQRILEEI